MTTPVTPPQTTETEIRPTSSPPRAERPGEPLLSVRDLVVRFRTHDATIHAVNGVTFELAAGETLGLVGESGCGKSVTSLALMRLLPKPAGRIEGGEAIFDGLDLVTLPEKEMRDLRGREIAMIFQDPMTSLNPVLTIEEQMVETIQAHRKISAEAARDRARELLVMVGIPEPEKRLKSYPHQFSGGMRQREMIAIALALEPRLMIADEPTTAVDVTIQAHVLELHRRLTDETGTAMILITHDLGVVAGMTQRINVMYAGLVVETAPTGELFANPSHPYTVGLLHSIPRMEQDRPQSLIPIEGIPPDQRREITGCPFAPRCAWRLEVCWTTNPPLIALDPAARVVTSGPNATHRSACHNIPTPEEAAAGRPLREGFAPAPPPGDIAAILDEEEVLPIFDAGAIHGDEFGMDLGSEGPASMAPSAGGLPLPPEEDRR
jgi:oligopeptide transport system ATP-binding protein